MKKLLTATLVLLMSASAMALTTSYTGAIVKIVAEDGEGTKIKLDIPPRGVSLFVTRGKKVLNGGMSDSEILAVAESAVTRDEGGNIMKSKTVVVEIEAGTIEIHRITMGN